MRQTPAAIGILQSHPPTRCSSVVPDRILRRQARAPGSRRAQVTLTLGVMSALLLLVAPGALVARRTTVADLDRRRPGADLWNRRADDHSVRRGRNPGERCDSAVGSRGCPDRREDFEGGAWDRDRAAEARAASAWPALSVGAGVLVGALLIGYATLRGLPHWQSIPSTWDSVWHANTIRFILDTGQASPTHMGERKSRDPRQTVLPVNIPCAGSRARPAHRRRAHDGLHAQLAGRGDLVVPGQRRSPRSPQWAFPHPSSLR